MKSLKMASTNHIPKAFPAVTMEMEIRSIELWRCVIVECLATFLFVLLGCASTLRWDPSLYAVHVTSADVIHVSLAFGFAMCALTQCFGHISGGHFNPAVTIATTLTCRVTPLRGLLYIGAQCGGGIAGAALLYGLTPPASRGSLGVTLLNPGLNVAQGFAIELLLTFLLTLTFFATVDPKRRNHGNQAIPIGVTLAFVHLVGYRLTGCSCNPARSLGPAFLTNRWDDHWIYWAGPLGGAVMAGVLHHFIFDPSKNRLQAKTPGCSTDTLLRDKAPLTCNPRQPQNHCFNTYKRHSALMAARAHHACENSAYDYNTAPRRNSATHSFTLLPPPPPVLENSTDDPWMMHRKY